MDLEALTHDYGRAIFAGVHHARPVPFGAAWREQRLMDWTMGEDAIKVQLFRFIDVLPMLHTPAEITRHLREYFTEAALHLPPWLRQAIRWMPSQGWPARALAGTARRNAERLARRFIAGSDLPETLATIEQLRRLRMTFTIDLLGEATITEVEAQRYQSDYLNLIQGLSQQVNRWDTVAQIDRDDKGPLPRVNVSIKLSSLYSQFDPMDASGTSKAVRARLRPILRAARAHRAFVNVDMEQYAYKDLTLRIFRDVLDEDEFRDWPDVGIAIQAYLQSCADDLDVLARWTARRGTPICVRLIKGAYWDYETVLAEQQDWPVPVFTEKWQTDVSYERHTHFLLERRAVLRPAFGSHNVRSIAHALAVADALGVPANGYELQMLFGMADEIKHSLVALGRRLRVYTPYGQLLPGMAYLVRRLLENTANESFLRASFTENVPEEQLLMEPSSFKGRTSQVQSPGSNGDLDLESWTLDRHSRLMSFRNEPLTDFSRQDAQRDMRQALGDVGGQLGREYPLVINGREVRPGETLDSVNPAHIRQVVGRSAKATPVQAQQAIDAAKAAFPAWRDTPARKRAEYLFRMAEVMRRRRFELAAWQVYECGKQWREADGDVAEAIDYCEYYGREMIRLAVQRHRDVAGEENEYFYEPRGITIVIPPWNFPLAIPCGMATAALVAGNPIVLKPAEQSPVIAAKLMEVFQDVGLPAGVANYLPGIGEEIGPTLVKSPDVAMIAFTGSREVGLLINRQAAEVPPGQTHVKRALAEMGGKNAIIVDSDADLDEAVHGVTASAFGYQGQKCSACARVIVLNALYDSFLARLIEATRSLKIGPPKDPGNVVGPLIDADAQRRVNGYIEKGKQEARLVYAGDVRTLANEGSYVAPHIFADVPPNATIAQEEIFGPVLSVLHAADLDEALAIANGTAYALTGGLYSRSPANIARVKREFRVGNLYINRKITGALVDRQPFGGFKLSGVGSRAGGPDYLQQFLEPRTITENTLRRGFAPRAAAQQGIPADAPAL